jgi:hypothetical protein
MKKENVRERKEERMKGINRERKKSDKYTKKEER